MGGDHHHHDHKVVIPDYRIYKVEDCPELLHVQKELAKKGLKDPWLRNEAWKFNDKEYGTMKSRVKLMWGRGLKIGFVAFGITLGLETIANMMSPPDPHHGHH